MSGRDRVEGGQLVLELAVRLDQAGDRRAAEVEPVRPAFAGQELPAPGGGRLAEVGLGPRAVAAGGGDEALHAREARDERGGEVGRSQRLERGCAQLRLRLLPAAEMDERVGAREPPER